MNLFYLPNTREVIETVITGLIRTDDKRELTVKAEREKN